MTKHANPVVRPLIKFSIYAVLCLVLLGVLAVQVGNIHTLPLVSHDHTYYADMTDASSLVPPDDVKIAGVTVGQVKGVSVRHGHAVVKFVVDKHIVLRESTQVGMRFQNVIGAKYLYLYPGSMGLPIAPGAHIALDHNVESADVGNFLTDVGAFLKALNPNDVNAFTQAMVVALQGNDVQVSQLFDNTAAVTQTVGSLDSQIGNVIDNLEHVLSALAARNADLLSLTDHLTSVAQQLAARNDVLDNVIVNFAQVNDQLNQLVTTNRGNLNQTINNLQVIANVLAQHHADLDKGLATLSSGLAPYTLISAYGQWFELQSVYTCVAQQTSCTYQSPTQTPATLANPEAASSASAGVSSTSGPAAKRAQSPSQVQNVGDVVGFALYGRAGG